MKLSAKGLQVLALFLSDVRREVSGAQIAKATGIGSGTLYPLLLRLEKNGWLQSRWEDVDATSVGRPRRRFYRLTAVGCEMGSRELSKVAEFQGAWAPAMRLTGGG